MSSVTIRYRDHIDWNSSKIISPPNSLRSGVTGTPLKLGWNRGELELSYRIYMWADYNFIMCTYLFTLRRQMATPTGPFRQSSNRRLCGRQDVVTWVWMKNETCDMLVPNELKNAEHLTVRLGLQLNRAIGLPLHSVVLMFIAQTMWVK